MSQLNLDLYEKVIVYNCLKTGNEEYLSSVVEHIDPELFNNRDAACVVEVIRDFYLENDTIPNRTEIRARINNKTLLESFKRLLTDFKDLDKDYTISELVKNTENFIKQRSLLKNIERSLEEHSSEKRIDEERVLKEFDKIQSLSLIDNLGLDLLADSQQFVDRLLQADEYISTGYIWLDRELGGGLHKEGKAIYGIAGETNVGKSIVLGNIGTNILLQGYNVVVISLEMSEFRYAKRLASMLSDIKQVDLANKTDEYLEFVTTFQSKNNGRLIIKEFPTKQVSAKHVAGYIKRLKRKKNFEPDVIVLDYHTLLKPSISQGSKHADMQFTTQESRALSYLFDAPVLSAAQLNRGEGAASGPSLDRIAGSWDMLSDMDYLVNIWQSDEDREAELLRWAIKKARDSERNNEHFWPVDYSTLRLLDDDAGGEVQAVANASVMTDIVGDLFGD
jgi:replicative DNA helicase|tara:strand:+ start:44382 stop:45728 length:1347 start_codon:yes stop_codon:yes gene_type:complete